MVSSLFEIRCENAKFHAKVHSKLEKYIDDTAVCFCFSEVLWTVASVQSLF